MQKIVNYLSSLFSPYFYHGFGHIFLGSVQPPAKGAPMIKGEVL